MIDSFRAAIPGQDENESSVRTFLDKLTRVSETTGCSFVVLHHAGKGSKEKDGREKGRGSGAIFDACGTVLDLQASKPFEPIRIELVKTSANLEGRSPQPFYVEFQDITTDDGADTKAGLLVEHKTVEQVEGEVSPISAWGRDLDEVLTTVRRNPNKTGSALARICGKRKDLVLDALEELERTGKVQRDKAEGRAGGGGSCWRVANNSPEAES
jgi:RecA-family ATPase